MDRFGVYQSFEGIGEEQANTLSSKDIVIPTIDEYSDYIYIREGTPLPKNLKIYNMGIFVTEKELEKFSDKIYTSEHTFEMGEAVFFRKYPNLPVEITDISDDVIKGHATIRHKQYPMVANRNTVTKAKGTEVLKYTYHKYMTQAPHYTLMVDGDYALQFMEDSYDVINFLLRVKSFCQQHAVVWCGKSNSYVDAVFKLFGLVTLDKMYKGDLLFSDKDNYGMHFKEMLTINSQGFIDRKYVSKHEAVQYLLVQYTLTHTSITDMKISNNFIQSVTSENLNKKINALPVSIREDIKKGVKGLSEYTGAIHMSIDHEDTYKKLESNGWIWFSENYDFYTSMIRG